MQLVEIVMNHNHGPRNLIEILWPIPLTDQ